MKKLRGPMERIKIGLALAAGVAFAGCVGCWDGGYYDGGYAGPVGVDIEAPVFFSGFFDGGHAVRGYSHRGHASHAVAHSGGRGHGRW